MHDHIGILYNIREHCKIRRYDHNKDNSHKQLFFESPGSRKRLLYFGSTSLSLSSPMLLSKAGNNLKGFHYRQKYQKSFSNKIHSYCRV